MIYVFFQYWIFIALALVLGLFVGWATCTGHDHNQRSNWLAWAVAAFLAGLFLAGFKWIPGLLGHLLEVALMLFAAYIIGCITGCGARSVAGGDDGGLTLSASGMRKVGPAYYYADRGPNLFANVVKRKKPPPSLFEVIGTAAAAENIN